MDSFVFLLLSIFLLCPFFSCLMAMLAFQRKVLNNLPLINTSFSWSSLTHVFEIKDKMMWGRVFFLFAMIKKGTFWTHQSKIPKYHFHYPKLKELHYSTNTLFQMQRQHSKLTRYISKYFIHWIAKGSIYVTETCNKSWAITPLCIISYKNHITEIYLTKGKWLQANIVKLLK